MWGASIAIIPGILSVPAVSYAGIGMVNMLWTWTLKSECPSPVYLTGGLAYGLALGPLFQCLLTGSVASLVWKWWPHRFQDKLAQSSFPVRAFMWITAEAIYVVGPLKPLIIVGYSGPWVLGKIFGM
jgi:hypothetical protein